MRIAVVGTSGSGKTTLGRALAGALGIAHVELDALNWEAGWRDLSTADPEEFIRRVRTAIEAESWVLDGDYGMVRPMIWRRATHLVWLDFSRPTVMYRVIKRSLIRAIDRTALWAGNREEWRRWLRPSHPIPWAWRTWRRRRTATASRVALPENAHLEIFHLRHPREAAPLLAEIVRRRQNVDDPRG